jgi:DNA-binding MarR family transcriptional regulator
MLLSKEVIIELHLTGYKIKRYIASMLRQQGVPLTPEQFMLIDLLWNEGEMTQQQLANQLKKDKNSVTMLVDAIESKGLVVRRQNTLDRRSNTVVLTEKALELKEMAKQKGISILDGMLEGISEEELHSFLNTLRLLNQNMTVLDDDTEAV